MGRGSRSHVAHRPGRPVDRRRRRRRRGLACDAGRRRTEHLPPLYPAGPRGTAEATALRAVPASWSCRVTSPLACSEAARHHRRPRRGGAVISIDWGHKGVVERMATVAISEEGVERGKGMGKRGREGRGGVSQSTAPQLIRAIDDEQQAAVGRARLCSRRPLPACRALRASSCGAKTKATWVCTAEGGKEQVRAG